MTPYLGEALVDTFAQIVGRLGPRARAVAGWVRRNASPPPGLVVHADDGSVFTGLLVIARNKVVAVLAAREAGAARAPLVTPPPPQVDPYRYRATTPYDEPDWGDELRFR